MDDYNQPQDPNPYQDPVDEYQPPTPEEKEERQWGLILHLSQLPNLFMWPAGTIAAIVIWQIKKDDLPGIDEHGKNATNWMISSFLYSLLCIPLIFVVIGIPLLIVLWLLMIAFPIIAAIKANDGVAWKYPLTISFL